MSTDWHVARNSCAGTAAHSTRLPQQRRQRRGTAAHSTRLQQQLRQHRGTAAALDSFLALWNQGVLCLASLSQGAFHFRCQLASRARRMGSADPIACRKWYCTSKHHCKQYQAGWVHNWQTDHAASPNGAGLAVNSQGALWAETRVP